MDREDFCGQIFAQFFADYLLSFTGLSLLRSMVLKAAARSETMRDHARPCETMRPRNAQKRTGKTWKDPDETLGRTWKKHFCLGLAG